MFSQEEVQSKQSPIQIEVSCSGSPAIDSFTFFSGAECLSVVEMRNCTSNSELLMMITLFCFCN